MEIIPTTVTATTVTATGLTAERAANRRDGGEAVEVGVVAVVAPTMRTPRLSPPTSLLWPLLLLPRVR